MAMNVEYVAFLICGFLFGLAAFMVIGALWLLNFAAQNAVAA